MRIKLIILGAVVVIAGLGLWIMLGWLDGLRQADLLQQAQTAYESGRHDQMAAFLQEAVAADPDNLKAWQAQAGLLDQLNDPACVSAYAALAKRQPDELDAQKAWLGAMVRYGRAGDALAAYTHLAQAGGTLAETAGFSLLGAKVAEAAGDQQARLRYLREACERDPKSGQLAFELAIAELQSASEVEIAPVLDRLRGLLTNADVQVEAARLLLDVGAKHPDRADLGETAQLIWDRGQSNLTMRLLALGVFRQSDDELFHEHLTLLMEQEQRDPQALTQIFDWLLAHGEYATIIDCATGSEVVTSMSNLRRPPVANRVAEAMIHADQLEALRRYDEQVDWDGAEGFGALLTPLTRTLDREEARTAPNPTFTRWLQRANQEELQELLPVTERLGLIEQEEAILEEMIRQAPWEREPYVQLYAIRRARRDSLGMLRLLQQEQDKFRQERDVSDEYAWVAMVLDVDRSGAAQLAQLNYSYDPQDPRFCVTWALALCLSGEPAKALQLLAAQQPLTQRGRIVQALGQRLLGDTESSDATLAEVDKEKVVPEALRMVLSSRPLPKSE